MPDNDTAAVVHKVDPALEMHLTPVSELHVHPDNVRRGDLDTIAHSFETFGQVKPIVARLDGTIVAGNHGFRAATENLGWTHVAAVKIDMTNDQAMQYLLMDNRASDKASYDQEALAQMLSLMSEAGLLDGTGYSVEDVADMLDDLEGAMEMAPQPTDAAHAEDPDQTAARYPAAGEHTPMREVVLLYTHERYGAFETQIHALKREWGVESTRDVVFEAVRRVLAGPPYIEITDADREGVEHPLLEQDPPAAAVQADAEAEHAEPVQTSVEEEAAAIMGEPVTHEPTADLDREAAQDTAERAATAASTSPLGSLYDQQKAAAETQSPVPAPIRQHLQDVAGAEDNSGVVSDADSGL